MYLYSQKVINMQCIKKKYARSKHFQYVLCLSEAKGMDIIMKIGILTFHRSINYGAFVQAYALQQLIKDKTGAEVEIIDYDSKISDKYYKEYTQKKHKKYLFKRFYINKIRSIKEIQFAETQRESFENARKRYMNLSDTSLISDDIHEFIDFVDGKYDLIIVGSDEIWRVNGMRGFPSPYWLPGVKGCIKMSFAASSRNTVDMLNVNQKIKIKEYLEDFSFISLRDHCSVKFIRDIIPEKSIHLMCDPTMAYSFKYDKNHGKQILKEKFGIDYSKPVIGVMDEFGHISDYVVSRYSSKVQIVPLYKYVKKIRNYGGINPIEWIDVISALDGLLTSFFHGMCISINTNTPFRVFEHRNVKDPMFSKSYDLLSTYSLGNLYCQMKKDNYKVYIDEFLGSILSGKMVEDYSKIKKGELQKAKSFLDELDKNCREAEK